MINAVMKFIGGLFFFLVCVINSLSAYNLRQVTNSDGITSSAVLSLLQDSNVKKISESNYFDLSLILL